MSEVLSQDEINELLTVISTGDMDDEEDVSTVDYELNKVIKFLFNLALRRECSKDVSFDILTAVRSISGVLHDIREEKKDE